MPFGYASAVGLNRETTLWAVLLTPWRERKPRD